MRELALDVLVVGAGPAGIAATLAARDAGCSVGVVDGGAAPGGQIWRRDLAGGMPARAARMLAALDASGAQRICGLVVDAASPHRLFVESDGEVRSLRCGQLILATGARERFLPFPGWTLPGVFGAGGLQALVKGGFDIAGKHVVVAGSGPLLLAVAAFLQERGALVRCIAEQADFAAVAAVGARLVLHPSKASQWARIERRLMGVSRRYATWPLRARGDRSVESVVLGGAAGELEIPCDALACGFGLIPDTRLARLLGCAVSGAPAAVTVDAMMRTSCERVFACGEVVGVGGVDAALLEGQIAGLMVAGRVRPARSLVRRRRRERRLAARIQAAFALRPELRFLPRDDTIVCRCEDVVWSAVRDSDTIRNAKLKTRCGMGPCQGRVCAPALEFLLGWPSDRVRSPLFPISMRCVRAVGAVRDSASAGP